MIPRACKRANRLFRAPLFRVPLRIPEPRRGVIRAHDHNRRRGSDCLVRTLGFLKPWEPPGGNQEARENYAPKPQAVSITCR